MTGTAALVWFKRELRVRDHAPLAEVIRFDSAIGFFNRLPGFKRSAPRVGAADMAASLGGSPCLICR
jgi:deoxyribodipyrimidine photolyase